MIAAILAYMNWRWIFLCTGTIGLLWTFWWTQSYFVPEQLSKQRPYDDSVETRSTKYFSHSQEINEQTPSWFALFRIRETWGLITAKFLSDAAWYFYLFWLPKYLYDIRGFDIKAVGTLAWIPYAAAGLGCLLGGGFSSYLVRRRFSLSMARKLALALSAAVMPSVLLVPHVPVSWAIVIFSLAYFGQQSWSTLVMVLPTDLFPNRVVGSVAGLVGFGGAMGGIAFGQLVGYLLDHGFGYGVVFTLAGTFHVIALVVILAAIPVVRPINPGQKLAFEGTP
jgi:ACS family hexuronate transporter-like MFS transporter